MDAKKMGSHAWDIPLMDYSSLPTMPANSPPRISLADMLMNQVTNPTPERGYLKTTGPLASRTPMVDALMPQMADRKPRPPLPEKATNYQRLVHALEGIRDSIGSPSNSAELALGLLGGPSLAMFAGPMAKTANQAALRLAQQLTESGASKKEVWDRTGWFTGTDGKWRFEIPDAGLKVNPGQSRGLGELSPVSHPELAEAYPQLQNMKVEVRPITSSDTAVGTFKRGLVNPSLRVNTGELYPPRETAAHELQHAIQGIEGFSLGSSTRLNSRDAYRRSAGEVEARNVEGRLGMSARERQQTPPWATQDVETGQQIVPTPSFMDRYGLPIGLASAGYGIYGLIDALSQKKPSP